MTNGGHDERGFPCRPAFASLRIMCTVHSPRHRTRAPWQAPALRLSLILLIGTLGCGRQQGRDTALSFEELSDTTGLARGAPVLRSFEPYRITGGALRVRGTSSLPDGTRLQVSVVRVATGETVLVAQMTVEDGSFETAPLMSPRGPVPVDLYRFDVLAHFNAAWQTEKVLQATHDGRSLRGPGITRGTGGQPAFFLREERRL
jgi:hypothetical protein